MTKVLFYAILSLLLQGCVGGAYLTSVTSDITDRGIYDKGGYLRNHPESSLNTKSSIEASLGKPDRATDDTWVYKHKSSRMFGDLVNQIVTPS
jgi:curved DNA-binding protein CbpA